MEDKYIIALLDKVGIRPTETRILIYKFILESKDTVSLGSIENKLLDIDKSTIFRTLILLEEQHLIHSIEDGSGALKYCLCPNDGQCERGENHCHFYCKKCNKTYCLDNSTTPNIPIADGFQVMQINYIIKGICKSCSKTTI